MSRKTCAPIQQAIKDGINVINFSISGGANAYTDPVELAFLDATAAGISVNASAGNSGPGAGTVDHGSPWVTTVGASTSNRHFQSTLTLTAADGASYSKVGSTLTSGVTGVAVVRAADVAGYTGGLNFLSPFAPGSLAGKVVVCQRGVNGRVEKGFNASQGGASGMILYNPTRSDTETDNHFLPAIHLEGPERRAARLPRRPPRRHRDVGHRAEGRRARRRDGRRSARAARSADFIKPDITAPGVQILAGNTPDADRSGLRPARAAVPGDRRNVDVEPAPGRRVGAGQGGPPDLDPGPDQVGADDLLDPGRGQGGRASPRQTRSTVVPVHCGSTPQSPPPSRSVRPSRGSSPRPARPRTGSTSTCPASRPARCRGR